MYIMYRLTYTGSFCLSTPSSSLRLAPASCAHARTRGGLSSQEQVGGSYMRRSMHAPRPQPCVGLASPIPLGGWTCSAFYSPHNPSNLSAIRRRGAFVSRWPRNGHSPPQQSTGCYLVPERALALPWLTPLALVLSCCSLFHTVSACTWSWSPPPVNTTVGVYCILCTD